MRYDIRVTNADGSEGRFELEQDEELKPSLTSRPSFLNVMRTVTLPLLAAADARATPGWEPPVSTDAHGR